MSQNHNQGGMLASSLAGLNADKRALLAAGTCLHMRLSVNMAQASSLAGALAQMGGAGAGAGVGASAAAGYQAAGLVVRLSVKLFNCTPAQLPAGLREQLCGWLNSTPACAEGFIRPGCLHITFQVSAVAS